MAGDFASQKYLGSMEGAVLSGKLAAEVICDKAVGRPTKGIKQVHSSITSSTDTSGVEEREPVGVRGNHPIAFGGGQQGTGQSVSHP